MPSLETHYVSGEPNTTGREPFEDPNRTGAPGIGGNTQHLSSGLTGGSSAGGLTGDHGAHSHSHSHSHNSGSGIGGAGEDYKNLAPGSAHAHGLGGHSHGHSHDGSGAGLTGTGAGLTGTGATHSHGHSSGNTASTGANTAVGSAVGTGASQAVGGEGHHGHHSHSGAVPGPGSTKPSGEGYGGIGAANTGSHVDRVGPQGQGSAAYERTSGDGPQTRGAAGTDRFDTGSTGAAHGSAENQDTSQRAPGKSSGGISGVLATSDKDFTGRERKGGVGGAYADSDGPVEGNTSGPKGHTALTGREGNLDENPVAQAKSRETGSTTRGSTTATNEGEHKGLMDKVKDAFKS